jgi:DNA replication and repair protein RecF
MFSPEDLDLIKDGPALRRRFMDMQLSQLKPSYFYSLQKYVSTLNQRNALLRSMAAPGANKNPAGQLEVWDEQLAREGAAITEHRRWFAQILQEESEKNYYHISGSKEEIFEARYVGALSDTDKLYEKMLEGLYKSRREDLRRCQTHFGPHRDDLHLSIKGQDMKNFASQGQMRTAALAMRLSQLTLMKLETGEAPVLLLDDVMSELDASRRAYVRKNIDDRQVIITTVSRTKGGVKMEGGKISPCIST